MATVVGKQSYKIDELLFNLVTNARIQDGHLILERHGGAEVDAGGVGTNNSVERLFYANGAYPTRPVGVLCVEWVGPIYPSQMTNKDSWFDTA